MQSRNNYNPDVLTCLANLSNDEVFTPPKLVNDILDLLPDEIWKDKNAKFLDPVCKTGVFVREIAKRLIAGLENEMPDIQERVNHIYKNQIFGIAITKITALLSRRGVYCSKKANGKYSVCTGFKDEQGNIKFNPVQHIWQRGQCTFCGASQSEYDRDDTLESHAYEFIHTKNPNNLYNNMKFDVIIGNPPYQLSDGGFGTSAKPIYHLFVEQAKKMNPRFLTMVIPSRWFAGGKGLDDFRKSMLSDKKIRHITDYHDAADCFPGVEIKGGVCFFLWDRDNSGDCLVQPVLNGNFLQKGKRILNDYDVFVRFNELDTVIKKVLKLNEKNVSSTISSRKPFGFTTSFTGYSKSKSAGAIKIYAQGTEGWIKKTKVIQNEDWINKEKVFLSKAYNGGYTFPHQIINKPFIPENPSCCTETYLVCGPFGSKKESENFVKYVKTKFFRALVFARKITQDNTKDRFNFTPLQDFSQEWTDERLYKKYSLTKDEIAFIESMIRPME